MFRGRLQVKWLVLTGRQHGGLVKRQRRITPPRSWLYLFYLKRTCLVIVDILLQQYIFYIYFSFFDLWSCRGFAASHFDRLLGHCAWTPGRAAPVCPACVSRSCRAARPKWSRLARLSIAWRFTNGPPEGHQCSFISVIVRNVRCCAGATVLLLHHSFTLFWLFYCFLNPIGWQCAKLKIAL